MTALDAPVREAATLPYRLDYETLAVPEEALRPVRHAIYHSQGPGFYLFKGFVAPAMAQHMKRFWIELPVLRLHRLFPGFRAMARGCPNFAEGSDGGNRSFFNFFWNHPPDEATYAVSMQVQWLRNRVMGRTPFEEIWPLFNRSTNYRIVINREGEIINAPHRDWTEEYFLNEPARLQATLFLSQPGIDYEGEGFTFTTNQGRRVVFGQDVPVAPGDLLLWRHSNEHSVVDVRSAPGQVGFVRILYTPDEVHDAPARGAKGVLTAAKEWVKRTPWAERAIVPLSRRLRGIK